MHLRLESRKISLKLEQYNPHMGEWTQMNDVAEHCSKTFSMSWEQLQNDCRALAWKILSARRGPKKYEKIPARAALGSLGFVLLARYPGSKINRWNFRVKGTYVCYRGDWVG
jgi:hypothetical protein